MAITHNFSDRQVRKLKFKISLYITIVLVLVFIVIIAISRLIPHISTQEIPQTEKQILCIDIDTEENISKALIQYSKENDIEISDTNCTIQVERNVKDPSEYISIFTKVYVVARNYDTIVGDIKIDEINNILNNQTYQNKNLVWDKETDQYIRSKFSIGVGQLTLDTDIILKQIKENNSIAILPFEKLQPYLSVISIDNENPLSNNFNIYKYILTDTYWIKGEKNIIQPIIDFLKANTDTTNYSPDKITSILLTGSSAMGSGEQQNIYAKSEDGNHIVKPIINLISQSDIAQINNEASYFDPCIQIKTSNKYCSSYNQISFLKAAGFDVVGVNGNHILDYGEKAFLNTLEIYNKNKIKYYGGGKNANEANTPAQFDTNGNRVYFLGYNFLYPFSYYSTNSKSGSANIDEKILENSLKKLSEKSIKIIDMSWGYDDKRDLVAYQQYYRDIAIDNGADIIIGTNSLITQKLEINEKGIVAQNIGSFLPANMDIMRRNSSLILIVYAYDNKIISTDVIPISLDKNNQISISDSKEAEKIYKMIK